MVCARYHQTSKSDNAVKIARTRSSVDDYPVTFVAAISIVVKCCRRPKLWPALPLIGGQPSRRVFNVKFQVTKLPPHTLNRKSVYLLAHAQAKVRRVRDAFTPDRARHRNDANVQSDRNGTDLRCQVGVAEFGPLHRPYPVVETAGTCLFIPILCAIDLHGIGICQRTNYCFTCLRSIAFLGNLVSTQNVMSHIQRP